MAWVNIVLPVTYTFIHKWNDRATPVFTPQRHRTLAGIHFLSCWVLQAELAWVAWWNTQVVCQPEDSHPSQY